MWKRNGIAAFMTRRMLARCASIRHAAIRRARDERQVLAEVQGFIQEMSLALRMKLLPDWCGALSANSAIDLEQDCMEFDRQPLAPRSESGDLLRMCGEVFAAASSRCAQAPAAVRPVAMVAERIAPKPSVLESSPTLH